MVPRFRRTLNVFLVAILIFAMLPHASASFGAYGTRVGDSTSDADITGLLLINLTSASLKTHVVAGDGTSNDNFYLEIDGDSSVEVLDIYLSPAQDEGTQVESGDSAEGDGLAALAGDWGYVDEDGDTELGWGEAVFLDTDNSGTVTAGDVQIIKNNTEASVATSGTTNSRAWTVVTGTNGEINEALTDLPAASNYAVLDMDGNGLYGAGDAVVIDMDGDNTLNPGDIRLTDIGSTDYQGTMARAGEKFTFHRLTSFAANSVWFGFDDADNDDALGSNEIAYLHLANNATVSVNDTEMSDTSGKGGAKVSTSDTAQINDALDIEGHLRYYDANQNGVPDTQDDFYIDWSNSSTNSPQITDIKLAKGAGGILVGKRVASGDTTDLNRNLEAALSLNTIRFLDVDADSAYGEYDIIYLDNDGNEVVTPGDLRLSGTASTEFGSFRDHGDTHNEPCFRFNFDYDYAIGHVDDSTPSVVGVDEPVYFDRTGDGDVDAVDIRLSGVSTSLKAGEFVDAGDSDKNDGLNLLADLPFHYFDANGDNRYSLGSTDDTIYLDLDGNDKITVGDVRITKAHTGSFLPGTKVQSGNGDLNGDLTAAPAGFAVRGYDANGDGDFTDADELYLSMDNATTDRPAGALADTDGSFDWRQGCATVGDVRLTGTGGAAGTGESGDTGDSGSSNNAPVARITCTVTVGSSEMSFSGTSSTDSDGTISSYSWNFGDGSTASTSTTTHLFQPGTYTVSLTVKDNDGSSRSTTLRVKAPAENANCAAPAATPEPTDTATPEPTESPSEDPTGSPDATPSNTTGDDDDPEQGTPGVAPAVLVLALIGLLFVLRRRSD